MTSQPETTQEKLEQSLTQATAQFIAASIVLSAPGKFTMTELEHAKAQQKAASEFLDSMGYAAKEATLVEPPSNVPDFLAVLAGKDARMPKADKKSAWVIPAQVYMDVLQHQYPSFNK